jgi:hypothetical protein
MGDRQEGSNGLLREERSGVAGSMPVMKEPQAGQRIDLPEPAAGLHRYLRHRKIVEQEQDKKGWKKLFHKNDGRFGVTIQK